MMSKTPLKILITTLVICALSLAGYLIGKSTGIPPLTTWTTDESKSIKDTPTDQSIERQILALAKRDPINAAGINFQKEGTWLYGIKTKDGWTLPGVPNDHPILTLGFPIKIISWTGEPATSARQTELNRAATEYALKYNQKTEDILLTN